MGGFLPSPVSTTTHRPTERRETCTWLNDHPHKPPMSAMKPNSPKTPNSKVFTISSTWLNPTGQKCKPALAWTKPTSSHSPSTTRTFKLNSDDEKTRKTKQPL